MFVTSLLHPSLHPQAKAPAERVGLELSPDMTAMIDNALAKATWDELQGGMAKGDLTLVHGDFHPGNLLVVKSEDPDTDSDADARAADREQGFGLRLVDWEVVGVGCGPQEMGQFMLSHSTPESRRSIEPAMLEAYTSTLNAGLRAHGKPELALADVKARYIAGGLARFMWMVR